MPAKHAWVALHDPKPPMVRSGLATQLAPASRSFWLSISATAVEPDPIDVLVVGAPPWLAWAKSVSGLRNDHGQIASLRGWRWSGLADPHQQKWMKLKIKLFAQAVSGRRHF